MEERALSMLLFLFYYITFFEYSQYIINGGSLFIVNFGRRTQGNARHAAHPNGCGFVAGRNRNSAKEAGHMGCRNEKRKAFTAYTSFHRGWCSPCA
jgi:hypothetical protein